jgi:hypothetical protein
MTKLRHVRAKEQDEREWLGGWQFSETDQGDRGAAEIG